MSIYLPEGYPRYDRDDERRYDWVIELKALVPTGEYEQCFENEEAIVDYMTEMYGNDYGGCYIVDAGTGEVSAELYVIHTVDSDDPISREEALELAVDFMERDYLPNVPREYWEDNG